MYPTTRNLLNTNGIADGIIPSVDIDKITDGMLRI
jgi:hypothetical protein